jgi:putative autotransporter adhesin-like protein
MWKVRDMRTLLFAAALIAVTAPADAAVRNFGITSFTKIRISGPYKVSLATGVAPFAKASGSPSAIDRVAIDVRGDTLVVQANPSWGGYPGADPGPVEISIGTHDLTNASLIGSGSIAIDKVKTFGFMLTVQGSGVGQIGNAAIDQLTVSLEGTANAKIAGKAGKVTALVRGMSALDAAKLTTPSADFSIDGTATIDANVTDTARVNGWGPSTVRLTGKPSCSLKVQGSASVSGCKSTQ